MLGIQLYPQIAEIMREKNLLSSIPVTAQGWVSSTRTLPPATEGPNTFLPSDSAGRIFSPSTNSEH